MATLVPKRRFEFGWDQLLIDELEQLRNCSPKPVISTSPFGIPMVRTAVYVGLLLKTLSESESLTDLLAMFEASCTV